MIASFYVRVLGMERVDFGDGRVALRFGQQKINLQPAGQFAGIAARTHVCGTADFCLVARTPLHEVLSHLATVGVEVIAGPSERTGALGSINSVYFRDPDGNLVEISNYPA
jgi:catechol 2,3-dioxygenase-like lactoylglutathione lyase family enzyme